MQHVTGLQRRDHSADTVLVHAAGRSCTKCMCLRISEEWPLYLSALPAEFLSRVVIILQQATHVYRALRIPCCSKKLW